jgi:hypothetical protein
MTDMRDFKSSNDTSTEIAFVDNGTLETKDSYVFEDSGGLGEFHRNMDDLEEDGSGRGKMISALIVALMLGAAGAYAYSMWTPRPNDAVADKDLPQPSSPKQAAMIPPPPAAEAPAPEAATTAPTAPDVVKPAPVTKQATISNAPRVARAAVSGQPSPSVAAPMTPAPSPATVAPPQQAAAVPEPVSPTPPASSLAANPPRNEPSAPVEAPAAPAPAPVEAAPAPAAPAEPAPAQ